MPVAASLMPLTSANIVMMLRRSLRPQTFALSLSLLALACGDDNNQGTDFGTATDPVATSGPTSSTTSDTEATGSSTTDDPSTTATTNDPSTTAASTGGTDSETDGDTDSAGTGTTTGLEIEPCVGLDVLFVVDNSTGMAEEQLRLSSTASSFVQMLADGVPAAMSNVNIGVITTDEPELVVPAEGMYASGEHYMTLATLAAGELETALGVGEAGDPNERPMDMLLEATAPPLTDGGNQNAGFLREDALLLVVLVTDEEDDFEAVTRWGSEGDPATWVETLSEVKGGLAKDIVVLSVLPTDAGDCAEDPVATRLIEFTEGFPRGAYYEVCELDYSTFLVGEIASINDACDNFTPP